MKADGGVPKEVPGCGGASLAITFIFGMLIRKAIKWLM
jgi:hypothetical protein